MSITIGSDSTIADPLKDGGCRKEEVAVAKQWTMANGSVVRQVVARRWRWTLKFDLGGESAGQPYYKLKTAYEAASTAASTWKPPDETGTYTCVFSGWSDEPYKDGAGNWRHKVGFTVEETTP